MTGTSSKKRAPGIFVALALALVCAFGVATPAWAATAADAVGLAKALAPSEDNPLGYDTSKVTVSNNEVTVIDDCTNLSDIYLMPSQPMTLTIQSGKQVTFTAGCQLYVYKNTGNPLTIGGTGVLSAGGNNYCGVSVGHTSAGAGELIIDGATLKGTTEALKVAWGTVEMRSGSIKNTNSNSTKCSAVVVGSTNPSRECLFSLSDGDISSTGNSAAVSVGDGTKTGVSSNSFEFVMTGGNVANETLGEGDVTQGFGVQAFTGKATVTGGTASGSETGVQASGGTNESTKAAFSGTVIVGGDAKVTGRYAAGVDAGGTLEIQGGTITGTAAGVGTNGSSKPASTITMTGGAVSGGTAGMFLPAPEGAPNVVTITGGTVRGTKTPSAGIINVSSNLTVGGSATITCDPGAPGSYVSIGDVKNPGGSPIQYSSAGITSASPGGYGQATETTINGGTVEGGVANGLPSQGEGVTNLGTDAPQLTVSGNANVQGNVTNQGAGSADLTGGTINGDIVNNAKPATSGEGGTVTVGDPETGTGPTVNGNVVAGEGSGGTTIAGGQIEGEVEGDVSNQTPPPVEDPGTPEAVDQQVAGVVGPVESAMAGSATVTPSDDNSVWTVEIVNGDMPVSAVAQNLVYQVVSALLRAGADPVASVEDSSLAVEPGDSYQQVLGFCEAVLRNAAAAADALPENATLADLSGMECGVVATLADDSTMSYTFAFTGEPLPPTPPTQQVLPVYRLYNPFDHLHLYTTDANEVQTLESIGWDVDFGGEPAWYAPTPGGEYADYEVVRLYNPNSGDHYFVRASDANQLQVLTGLGWEREGSGASIWSAAPTSSDVQVYTLFNRFNLVDTHLYTASRAELDALVGPNAWEQQASVLWGVPEPLA